MSFQLAIDGDPHPTERDPDDIPSAVLERDEDAPTWQCRACGQPLVPTTAGYVDPDNDQACPAADPTDNVDTDDLDDQRVGLGAGHDPEPVPLGWINSAGIHPDPDNDTVSVTLSVGDPRGAFRFDIRRVPSDVDSPLAGRLLLCVPYPGQPSPHRDLTPLHDGTYLIS